MTTGHTAKFVKAYADLRGSLTDAAQSFAEEVRHGVCPGPEHTYTELTLASVRLAGEDVH